MIIALDGPAGSGKSTIAKTLAKYLSIEYLDTGAMYRAICVYLIENNIQVNSIINEDFFKELKIDIEKNKVYLNDKDVTRKIREEKVNVIISKVAKNKYVREYLVNQQREIASGKDIILDGRDIGTIVFPNAEFKFYIDASVQVRAQRRVDQNKEIGLDFDFEEIKHNIEARDFEDKNREIGPLKIADDALIIDTSELTLDETIDVIRKVIDGK